MTTEWQSMESAPKDGTLMLLHVDWEPLTVVGYWGSVDPYTVPDTEPPLTDDGAAVWRAGWDNQRIDWGYDEPTHWAPLPADPEKKK